MCEKLPKIDKNCNGRRLSKIDYFEPKRKVGNKCNRKKMPCYSTMMQKYK